MKREKNAAIILAAGQGKRMNSPVQKQYLMLNGYPILYYSLKAFEDSQIDEIILVTGQEELAYCQQEIVQRYHFRKIRDIVPGGKERYHSVYEGLRASQNTDYVLIHDGARPFVTEAMIERTLKGARKHGACVAGMPAKDTVKIADGDGFAKTTPKRSLVWTVQTPQAFSYELISKAYHKLLQCEDSAISQEVTDDAMVLEVMTGRCAKLTEGSYENIKITTPSDLQIAEVLCKKQFFSENKKTLLT